MPTTSIRKQAEFDRVFDEGSRISGRLMAVIVRRGVDITKLGIVVGKKYGGAVQRARMKRLIREAFRSIAESFKSPAELIVLPKHVAGKVSMHDIAKEMRTLTIKAGIL